MPTITRAEYAAAVRADRQSWRDLVNEVGRDRVEEPGPMGEWSFRDLAGHLAGWRNRTIAKLEAMVNGKPEPPDPWPSDLDDDDPINAWIRDHDRTRSTDEILQDYDASFERLATAVEQLSDEQFNAPLPWGDGTPLSSTSPRSGHLHDEHEPSVREWLATRPPRA